MSVAVSTVCFDPADRGPSHRRLPESRVPIQDDARIDLGWGEGQFERGVGQPDHVGAIAPNMCPPRRHPPRHSHSYVLACLGCLRQVGRHWKINGSHPVAACIHLRRRTPRTRQPPYGTVLARSVGIQIAPKASRWIVPALLTDGPMIVADGETVEANRRHWPVFLWVGEERRAPE